MIKNVNFSIEEKILKEFIELAKENCLNKSKYVEKCMLDYIKNNQKENGQKTKRVLDI